MRIALDAMSMVSLGWIIFVGIKCNRNLRDLKDAKAKLDKFWRERHVLLMTTLEALARERCPLCAAADGMVAFSDEQGPLAVEPEIGGRHSMTSKDGCIMQADCKAASVRASARELFDESMKEIEDGIKHDSCSAK